MVDRLNVSRALLVTGLAVGLLSWRETAGHIGDPLYALPPGFPEGTTHARYHALRETSSDVAQMAVFLLVFFGPVHLRTRAAWWLLLILMLGYYAPFWIGAPFQRALSAPSRIAGAIHLAMAGFAFAGLLVAWPEFGRRQPSVVDRLSAGGAR